LPPVTIKLYTLPQSHPGYAARLMLDHKDVEHEVVQLVPGFHPLMLRALRFRGGTVPAVRLDGRRVQGSLSVSRALDQAHPSPPLFPTEPERRREVEEAERWGERDLQEVPRRLLRWAVARHNNLRADMARQAKLPAPEVAGAVNVPLAMWFARGMSDDVVRENVAAIPRYLDRVEDLMERGVIGGDEPNAADFQIAPTVRLLLTFDDLRPAIEGRPAADFAMRHLPRYPLRAPEGTLPADWLASLRG
jgi:glutathione S-transferase